MEIWVMAGYAPLTRPTKTKTPVGRVKTRHQIFGIEHTLDCGVIVRV